MSWENKWYNGIPQGWVMSRAEADHRGRAAQGRLLSEHGIPPVLESGHHAELMLSPSSGDWRLVVYHPGDSSGRGAISHLGQDDERAPARAAASLRDRDMAGFMQGQWERAHLNGDPTGTRPDLRTWDVDQDEVNPDEEGPNWETSRYRDA